MDHLRLQSRLQSAFLGSRCTSANFRALESWQFQFDNGATLHIQCPWRIIVNGRIAFGNCDHNQLFGGAESLNGEIEALKLLQETVEGLFIRTPTSDLILDFSGGARLEVFLHSSGYEGWESLTKNGLNVIALGGGEITYFD